MSIHLQPSSTMSPALCLGARDKTSSVSRKEPGKIDFNTELGASQTHNHIIFFSFYTTNISRLQKTTGSSSASCMLQQLTRYQKIKVPILCYNKTSFTIVLLNTCSIHIVLRYSTTVPCIDLMVHHTSKYWQ